MRMRQKPSVKLSQRKNTWRNGNLLPISAWNKERQTYLQRDIHE